MPRPSLFLMIKTIFSCRGKNHWLPSETTWPKHCKKSPGHLCLGKLLKSDQLIRKFSEQHHRGVSDPSLQRPMSKYNKLWGAALGHLPIHAALKQCYGHVLRIPYAKNKWLKPQDTSLYSTQVRHIHINTHTYTHTKSTGLFTFTKSKNIHLYFYTVHYVS